MLKIALDVDGVLADVIESWLEYNNKIRNIIVKTQISEWDFWKDHNIDKYDFYNELSICWKSWHKIPPTEDKLSQATTKLANIGVVDIVTARDEFTHNYVKDWLKFHKVKYRDYIGVREGKEKSRLDYDVFIDDSPNNASNMLEAGKSVILYTQPWNTSFHDPRAQRIHKLESAITEINKMNCHLK